MTPAQQSSVVFASVEMLEIGTKQTDGTRNIPLFDVGMEGVDGDPDPWMINRLAESLRLFRRSEKERLRAIHRFNRQIHLMSIQRFANDLKCLDRPRPFFRSRAVLGKVSDRSIDWAAEELCTKFRTCFDTANQVV
jgi:hypothetical protein